MADRLQGGHVIDGGEGVIQRGEADAGLGGLPFGPLVAVDAQLGVEREVAAELEEERAEVLIDDPAGATFPQLSTRTWLAGPG